MSKQKTNGASLRLIWLKLLKQMQKKYAIMREIAGCFMTYSLQTKRLAYVDLPR